MGSVPKNVTLSPQKSQEFLFDLSKYSRMERCAHFTLKLLGTPLIQTTAAAAPNIPRTLIWCLLARLVDEPNGVTRKILCEELQTTSDSLRKAISECNHNDHPLFGTPIFETEKGTLRLRPGFFAADTTEFTRRVQEAEDAADPKAEILALENALALVRGDFMDGLAKPTRNRDDWVTERQKEWREQITDAGKRLITLYRQSPASREIFERVRGLATRLPPYADLQTQLLRYQNQFGDLQISDNASLAEWMAFLRQLAKRGLTVTLSETRQFDLFFRTEWKRLSEEQRFALERLCILEGSFDAELAAECCEVTPDQLVELTNRALLIAYNAQYEMPILIRDWIRDPFPEGLRVERTAAYHEWVRHTFVVVDHERLNFNRAEIAALWQPRKHHLQAALDGLLDAPIPEPIDRKLYWYDFCLVTTRSFFPERRQDAFDFLNRLLDNALFPIVSGALSNIGRLLITMHQYTDAERHFAALLPDLTEFSDKLHDYNFLHYTDCLHRKGKTNEAVDLIENFLPFFDRQRSHHFVRALLIYYTEYLLALQRFEDALAISIEAMGLFQKFPDESPAPALYHQGMALAGLGRKDEAIAAWNEALELFGQIKVAHGEADCLQQLGKLYAQNVETRNIGKRMIEEALEIYASIPQMQSRAACLRSLGDVLKLKGDHEGAQAAYCEGLTFWENEVEEGRGGDGWVRRFQERLADLG
jgi:tetratricopeptide (TPR) repeat protein